MTLINDIIYVMLLETNIWLALTQNPVPLINYHLDM